MSTQLDFVCPICASRSHTFDRNQVGFSAYVCDGCSVVFKDPQKFTHENPGEPLPETSPTSDKFTRNRRAMMTREMMRHGPDEIDTAAMDAVYERLHRWIEARDWPAIDADLRGVDVEREAVPVLLAYLTLTAWAGPRNNMTARGEFFARVRGRLGVERGGEAADLLLKGLK